MLIDGVVNPAATFLQRIVDPARDVFDGIIDPAAAARRDGERRRGRMARLNDNCISGDQDGLASLSLLYLRCGEHVQCDPEQEEWVATVRHLIAVRQPADAASGFTGWGVDVQDPAGKGTAELVTAVHCIDPDVPGRAGVGWKAGALPEPVLETPPEGAKGECVDWAGAALPDGCSEDVVLDELPDERGIPVQIEDQSILTEEGRAAARSAEDDGETFGPVLFDGEGCGVRADGSNDFVGFHGEAPG